MEYLLGSIVTSLTILLMYRWLQQNDSLKKPIKVDIRQSKNFSNLIKLFTPEPSFDKATTQSQKHFDKIHLRVLVLDGNAYWIANNIFYTADIINGDIDKDNARQVDTMTMDKVQLKKMMFIIEKLTEGLENDSRNSGNEGV